MGGELFGAPVAVSFLSCSIKIIGKTKIETFLITAYLLKLLLIIKFLMCGNFNIKISGKSFLGKPAFKIFLSDTTVKKKKFLKNYMP